MPVAMTCLPLVLVLALSLQDKAPPSDPAEPLRKFWKPVTLAVQKASAQEVLQEIMKQSGETLQMARDWEPKSISVDLKGVPFWRAVDEVCRLDGNLGLHPSRHNLELRLGAGVPPTAYAGPVRFAIQEVVRVREIRYPARFDRTEISVVARWTSGYTPILDPWPYPGTLEVVRAMDRQGRSLLPPVALEETFVRSAGGSSGRSAEWLFRLQPADRTERVLPVVDLRWKPLHAEEVEDVVFENPLQTDGVARRVGDFTVTLQRCARDEKGGSMIEARLALHADSSTLAPEARRAIEEVPLQRRMLNESELDGKKGWQFFKVMGDGRNPFDVALQFWMDGEHPPQKLKLRVARRVSSLSIPITFADVPIPEAGK